MEHDTPTDTLNASNPVLSGLIRKRQEVMEAMELAQTQLRQLVLDLDALDGVIRMFSPEIDLAVVRVRPRPKRHIAFRGEVSRLILTLLRDAPEPLPTREVVRRVMETRELNQADRALYDSVRDRVGASLRGMRSRGRIASSGDRETGVRWGLT